MEIDPLDGMCRDGLISPQYLIKAIFGCAEAVAVFAFIGFHLLEVYEPFNYRHDSSETTLVKRKNNLIPLDPSLISKAGVMVDSMCAPNMLFLF